MAMSVTIMIFIIITSTIMPIILMSYRPSRKIRRKALNRLPPVSPIG